MEGGKYECFYVDWGLMAAYGRHHMTFVASSIHPLPPPHGVWPVHTAWAEVWGHEDDASHYVYIMLL